MDATTKNTNRLILRKHSKATHDFWILIVAFIILITIAIYLDLFEQIKTLFISHDRYELDDVLLVFSIFSLFICLYAMRRWRELVNAIKKQKQADRVLKKAHLELKKKTEELEVHNRLSEQFIYLAQFFQVCKTKAELFQFIGHSTTRLFPGANGALYISKASRDQLLRVVHWGEAEDVPEFIYPDDCWGLRLGKQYTATAGMDNPLCRHYTKRKAHGHHCIPLTAYGEIIGLFHISLPIAAADTHDKHPHKEQEHSVPLFTEQISLAISNLSLHEQLRDMAIHDPLTGLYNRQYLNETVEREILRARRNQTHPAIIIIDLDHFKQFNDTFGHFAGDLVLKETGKLLKTFFREEDFCCRYGGEEFLVLLPDITARDLKTRCEGLRKCIGEMDLAFHGQPVGKVTGSMGAAIFPDNGETFVQLVQAADDALYTAKKEGRDRVCLA